MNAVWNSYGQLCGCPEIFKKSCKLSLCFFELAPDCIMGIGNTHLFCYNQNIFLKQTG